VSEHVTLTLRAPLTARIEADCIAADRFAVLGEPEIADLPIWAGREQRTLGDVFDVHGERTGRLRIVGDVRLAAGIGSGMAGGELIIDGNAGDRTGSAMTGGFIDVRGSVGDDAGCAMTGGAIHIRGGACDRVGGASAGASRGMTGGEIVVDGSVGTDAGARMRRGLLFVGGDTGHRPARAMIAGTVVVLGSTGAEPALASKRGSLIVGGELDIPVTYRFACTYHAPHVRAALTHIRRRYGVAIEPRFLERPYRRFCGDAGTVGRGEILWLS
jgi:formylmethanofuran dehydrogenase subunit C